MATPVFSDKALDACIARSLSIGPAVTSAQQLRAWERVRLRAEQQVQLPPLDAARKPLAVRAAALLTSTALALLRTLISNDEMLLRAYSRPHCPQRCLCGTLCGGFGFCY